MKDRGARTQGTNLRRVDVRHEDEDDHEEVEEGVRSGRGGGGGGFGRRVMCAHSQWREGDRTRRPGSASAGVAGLEDREPPIVSHFPVCSFSRAPWVLPSLPSRSLSPRRFATSSSASWCVCSALAPTRAKNRRHRLAPPISRAPAHVIGCASLSNPHSPRQLFHILAVIFWAFSAVREAQKPDRSRVLKAD